MIGRLIGGFLYLVRVAFGILLTIDFIWMALIDLKDHTYGTAIMLLVLAYLVCVFHCTKVNA